MNSGRRGNSAGVTVPAEQRTKAKVLDNREFGEHFGVVHLDHTLQLSLATGSGGERDVLTLFILAQPARTPDISYSIWLCS